ncbi:hypothetical protein E2C01_086199 [Portunus trituberculatus]|uniref:Uncharacterized protein n=1 Tax=Portunus trituberculatus TaxID=210409 RepID=A0A5B7J356_PORTR|nr:hypothetical protein [Portunus trituberculatus]
MLCLLYIDFCFSLPQNLKNQIMTTNLWVEQVSSRCIFVTLALCHTCTLTLHP